MKNLEAKTDHQLNTIVGKLRQRVDRGYYADYCGKWEHCGQLIDELQIETDYIDGFGATTTKNSISISCYDNIKRAVTIVYILIKQQGGSL